MKSAITALLALSFSAFGQDHVAKDEKFTSEREGAATVLHRDAVLRDRGGRKQIWPLLNTPEARMNYFEVTGRGALHYHPDADHRLYVLEGTVLVT